VKVIDEIIPEPVGGAHRNPDATFEAVGQAIAQALNQLERIPPSDLLDARLDKFDQMGVFQVADAPHPQNVHVSP
jgi:acetyl-CoA carboxylase carboxyl transferase subunit alpha